MNEISNVESENNNFTYGLTFNELISLKSLFNSSFSSSKVKSSSTTVYIHCIDISNSQLQLQLQSLVSQTISPSKIVVIWIVLEEKWEDLNVKLKLKKKLEDSFDSLEIVLTTSNIYSLGRFNIMNEVIIYNLFIY